MSPAKASAAWSPIGRLAAFQPKRPSIRPAVLGRSRPRRRGPRCRRRRVVGVGAGQDVGRGDRLEQAEADHRRGDAGRDHQVRVQAGRSRGPSMRVGRAAQAARPRRPSSGTGELGPVDHHPALGRMARDAEGLELAAVGRLGAIAGMRRCASAACSAASRGGTDSRRNSETPPRPARRRLAAAVLEVAGLAGAGVVQRPEPVRRLRVEAGAETQSLRKKPSPTLKSSSPLEGQVGRGLREGVALAARRRGGAAGRPRTLGRAKSVVGAVAARARPHRRRAHAPAPAEQRADQGGRPAARGRGSRRSGTRVTGRPLRGCRGFRSPRTSTRRARSARDDPLDGAGLRQQRVDRRPGPRLALGVALAEHLVVGLGGLGARS